MKLIFIGPAASGKTTLVWKFGNYLERQGYNVAKINLDCAVEKLPYKASFDIRRYFTLQEIMKKFKLGPNGALMKSVEFIFKFKKEIKKHFDNDFVLVDVPGQLEVLLFHKKNISELFKKGGVAIFLIPADLVKNSKDYYFLRLVHLAIRYRIDLPCIYAISKSDLIKKKISLRKIKDDLSKLIYEVLKKVEQSQRIINISREGEGFEDLYSLVHEVFCSCGDLS